MSIPLRVRQEQRNREDDTWTQAQEIPKGKNQSGNQVVEIEVINLVNHERMNEFSMDEAEIDYLVESISTSGILQPIVVRPHPNLPGKYQVLSGHRRKRAAERLHLKTVPCTVMDLNDNQADTVFYVTNLTQRTALKPSERANAYAKMKEALEREGSDRTTAQVAQMNGENIRVVQRYIKIASLNQALLQNLDEGKISLRAATVLSDLTAEAQGHLVAIMNEHGCDKLTEEQAKAVVTLPRHDRPALERSLFPIKERKRKAKPQGFIKIPRVELEKYMEIDGLSEAEIKDLVLAIIQEYKERSE